MREKLIYLCDTNSGYVDEVPADKFADYLIANDVIPVVRCKDCEYRHNSCFAGNGNIYCDLHKRYSSLDGFCHCGERREGK